MNRAGFSRSPLELHRSERCNSAGFTTSEIAQVREIRQAAFVYANKWHGKTYFEGSLVLRQRWILWQFDCPLVPLVKQLDGVVNELVVQSKSC